MPRGRRITPEERLAGVVLARLMQTRQGRVTLLILALLVLSAYAGWWVWANQLRPRHPVGPTVRVATWNLRQFSPERRGVNLRAIADVISSNNFDVVALEEVKREGEEVDRLLNVLGMPWRATHFSEMTGNHERFVFLYNGDHVQEAGSPRSMSLPEASVFDRVPYQQTFRAGNFDFTLIAVHLNYSDARARTREAEALAGYAARLAEMSSEKDVIVLGDFNEQRTAAGSNLHFFLAQGWESLNAEPTNLKGSEIYDTLLIDPRHTHEWNGTAGAVRFDESSTFGNDDKRAVDEVSDHRPAYADFVTTLPDDD
jgi:endonuclease/exonuclease/phosphatase family metal-dependent hydrolase